jgi:hypothetical protein
MTFAPSGCSSHTLSGKSERFGFSVGSCAKAAPDAGMTLAAIPAASRAVSFLLYMVPPWDMGWRGEYRPTRPAMHRVEP